MRCCCCCCCCRPVHTCWLLTHDAQRRGVSAYLNNCMGVVLSMGLLCLAQTMLRGVAAVQGGQLDIPQMPGSTGFIPRLDEQCGNCILQDLHCSLYAGVMYPAKIGRSFVSIGQCASRKGCSDAPLHLHLQSGMLMTL